MSDIKKDFFEETKMGSLIHANGLKKLETFASIFREWNHKINLISRRGVSHLEERHFKDSLPLAKHIQEGSRCIDVGSGGGLPGIVVAVLRPHCEFHLVEPTKKKTLFLREVKRKLHLDNLTVIEERIEDLAVRDLYDEAFSRATFEPKKWIEIGNALVKKGGLIWLFLSETQRENLDARNRFYEEEYFLDEGRKRILLGIQR